jgi:hypothetical protein
MIRDKIAGYLESASECSHAAETGDESAKQHWLEAERQWLSLAEEMECAAQRCDENSNRHAVPWFAILLMLAVAAVVVVIEA